MSTSIGGRLITTGFAFKGASWYITPLPEFKIFRVLAVFFIALIDPPSIQTSIKGELRRSRFCKTLLEVFEFKREIIQILRGKMRVWQNY